MGNVGSQKTEKDTDEDRRFHPGTVRLWENAVEEIKVACKQATQVSSPFVQMSSFMGLPRHALQARNLFEGSVVYQDPGFMCQESDLSVAVWSPACLHTLLT